MCGNASVGAGYRGIAFHRAAHCSGVRFSATLPDAGTHRMVTVARTSRGAGR